MKSSVVMRSIAPGACAIAFIAVASNASASGYGAIRGTTANKSFTNWSEFNVGGVKNTASTARDWLIPIDLRGEGCTISACPVKAAFRGGSTGNTCVTAYLMNNSGAFTASFGPVCRGATLGTSTLGSFTTDYPHQTMLVVANVAGGATPGAITSVAVETGNTAFGGVGAIRGATANFSTSNWGEYNIGGIQNRATTQREWLISVPIAWPAQSAGFGGGFGGSTCVIAYGVNYDGTLASATSQVCQTSYAHTLLGSVSGVHALYVNKLAGASSVGATDGGFVTTVQY
jgi:hypothetical protein